MTQVADPDVGEFVQSMAWRSVAALAGLAGSFALTVLSVRLLPVRAIPTFYLALTALMVAPMLGRLGVSTAAVRHLAGLRAGRRLGDVRAVVRRTTTLTLAAASVTALLTSVAVVVRTPQEPRLLLWAVVAVLLFSEAVRWMISDVFSGLGRPGWSALMAHQPRAALGALAAGGYVLIVERATLAGLLLVLTAVSAALTSLGGVLLWRAVRCFPRASVAAPRAGAGPAVGLMVGVPLLIVDLALFAVGRLDVWIASIAFPAEVAVRYSTASVLAMQLTLPIGLLALAIAPLIAGLADAGELARLERVLRSVATLSLLVFVPTVAALALGGGWLFEFVYGPEQRAAAPIFVVLSLGALALAAFGLGQPVLVMTGNARRAAVAAVAIVALWIPAGWFAASAGGPYTLAAVSTLSTVALHLCLALLARRLLSISVWPYHHRGAVRGGWRWATLRSGAEVTA